MNSMRALALALAAYAGAAAASDMSVADMARIGHASLLEQRLSDVVETYGTPTRLGAVSDAGELRRLRGDGPAPSADWALTYLAPLRPVQPEQSFVPGLSPADFSVLVVMAAGGKGLVTRDADGGLHYEVPADPYRAHEVYAVAGHLKKPLPVDQALAAFAPAKATAVLSQGRKWLRIWALRSEGEMPLRMYAVDLGLNESGREITDLVLSGSGADFVRAELHARHRLWERNLND